METTQPALNITYSDYNYLINLFNEEYNEDEVMTQDKIDYILNFSQSPTTKTFFDMIMGQSSIMIPNDQQIQAMINALDTIPLSTTDTIMHRETTLSIFKEMLNTPLKDRKIYFKHNFIPKYAELWDRYELEPIQYREFMDIIEDLPMQFVK